MPSLTATAPGALTLSAKAKDAVDTLLEQYWKEMDKEFKRVEDRTNTNYWVNVTINIIIVALGVGLILVSAFHSLIVGADLFSGITSAIGVADFATIFLVNPQEKIRRALADFAQMQMIYATWANQTTAAYLQMAESGYTATEIKTFEDSLSNFTKEAVDSIETNIGTG
jgi:uncharacterized membrane protein (DUF485 family)